MNTHRSHKGFSAIYLFVNRRELCGEGTLSTGALIHKQPCAENFSFSVSPIALLDN